ncbi:pyridoxal phosphate-dependent aminotransferase [Patescibacteria group bacterium]|nr:pyridoxal phosphate-dependent aminotransferase [Patescibacteria group bacterium]
MKLSKRATNMQASPIRKLYDAANEAKERGTHIYHVNIGQPDIKTPKSFVKALKEFEQDVIEYAPSHGMKECHEAYQRYYQNKNIKLKQSEIVITTGGSEAIVFALAAVTDPGDEVLVFEPFYTNYNGFASMVGTKLRPITLNINDGFHLPDSSEIESKISQKTKAILLCNPNNPTGTVYTKKELDAVVKIAEKYNLFLIADEVYSDFVFSGKHKSLLQYPQVEDKVIVIDSVSKKYSSCGVRIGAFISRNQDLIATAIKLGQARLSVATIEQRAAAKMIGKQENYLKKTVAEYQKRRDVVFEELQKIKGVTLSKPEGAFYNIVGLPIKDAEHFAKWLLEEFSYQGATVMVAPAEGFYATKGKGKNEIRIAYVLKSSDMRKAMKILEKGLEEYQKNN